MLRLDGFLDHATTIKILELACVTVDNEVMQDLNKDACRITLNGKRHYTTPLETGPAPSVTTILSETASEKNKAKLEMWSKNNPGVKERAAERGTSIHYGMECYFKKEPINIPEEYSEFWDGMPDVLNQFDLERMLWAESPVVEDFMFTEAVDGVARVWGKDDEGRSWAGAPDIIGYTNKGDLTLGDLKTSVKPYYRHWPTAKKGSQEWREGIGGHMKYKKTVKQLAAYDLAIQQTLGIKVDQAAILVSTPVRTQIFKISRKFLDMVAQDWLKIVATYYEQIERANVYSADLV